MNIYIKQMKKLGLNTKEYSKLIDFPYEIVKNIIYNKEGEYGMDIKNILRKNMFDKHQELENDIENAKIKALEIKKEENDLSDYLEWYNNEYNFDRLKEKCDVKSVPDFEDNYKIIINNKIASHWFYSCLVIKKNYGKRGIKKEVINEFAKQLYDILENNNLEKYKYSEDEKYKIFIEMAKEKALKKNENRNNSKCVDWFSNFDLKEYMHENKLSPIDVSKELGVAISTFYLAQSKRQYSKDFCIKLKKWYDERESEKQEALEKKGNDSMEFFKELEKKEKEIDKINEQLRDIKEYKPTIEVINNNDSILRKLLVNRLTEEEKELIRIFGGNIN